MVRVTIPDATKAEVLEILKRHKPAEVHQAPNTDCASDIFHFLALLRSCKQGSGLPTRQSAAVRRWSTTPARLSGNYPGPVVPSLSVIATCTDTADNPNNATVDGAFAAYFSTVAPWLDPGPGSCTPTALSCTDETDNDCDNLVDQDDADECPPPPGGTGGKGDDCLSDSDCLSNSCSKGKPGTRICN